MHILLKILLCCIVGLLPAGAIASPEVRGTPAPASSKPTPPSHLRATLLMTPPSHPLGAPMVQLNWNFSPDPTVDGYRILLNNNGEVIEARVGPNQQSWKSRPITLSYPLPSAQVFATRGDEESRPEKKDIPLVVTYSALTARESGAIMRELPAATIRAITEDPTTRDIWVGTDGGGLARLDPITGNSEWLTELDGLGGNHVYALLFSRRAELDKKKPQQRTLWVATENSVTRITLRDKSRRIEVFDYLRDIESSLWSGPQEITTMVEDRNGVLWLGTIGQGLLHFDPITHVGGRLTIAEDLIDDTVWSIYEDAPGGRLWLATNKGLGLIDPSLERPRQAVLRGMTILSVAPAAKGRLWLVTHDKLINFSPDTLQLKSRHTFESSEDPRASLLLSTREGELWIGTTSGLRRFRHGAKAQDFRPVPLENLLPYEGPDLTDLEITALRRGSDGAIWAGFSEGQGLARYDPQSGETELYSAGNVALQLPIYAMLRDRENALWIGSERGPIWMDPERRFESYAANSSWFREGARLPPQPLLSMAMDSRGDIWFGLKRKGVFRYDNYLKRFIPFIDNSDEKERTFQVNAIAVGNAAVFLGTEKKGVLVFGPNTGEEYTGRGQSKDNPLTSTTVLSLLLDGETLWVGTAGGLLKARFNSRTNAPPQLRLEQDWPPPELPDPLRQSSVNGITVDESGDLWVASASGLWRSSLHPNNPNPVWEPVFTASIDRAPLCVTTDATNRIWVGTNRGLYRISRDPTSEGALTEEPINVFADAGRVTSIVIDDLGMAWAGTSRGLVVVPPFSSTRPSRQEPSRDYQLLIILLALSLLAIFWWYRTFRNPLVTAVDKEPEALAEFRLPELPMAAKALKRAHRLNASLILLGVDHKQWELALEAAELWPEDTAPIPAEDSDRLVEKLATILDAELLPIERFRATVKAQAPVRRAPSTAKELDTSELPFDTETIENPPPLPDEGLEGFDRGAPGVGKERDTSNENLVWKKRAASDELKPRQSQQDLEPSETAYTIVKKKAANESQTMARVGTTSLDEEDENWQPGYDRGEPLPYMLRLRELPIRLTHREIPLVVVRRPLPEDYPSLQLLKPLKGLTRAYRYILVLNLTHQSELPKLSLTGARCVVLNEEAIREMLFSANPRTTFVRQFIRQVKVTEVSPYSSKGEVANPYMFVGRRIEMDRITGNDRVNYSIVGARQIGKSSFMGAIKRHYRDNSNRDVHAFTLTPQEDARGFYKRFARLLGENRIPRDSGEFGEMMEAYYGNAQPPTLFLIDEVDGLLSRERAVGYPVLTAIRRLQQQEICSFVMAGYWELFRLGNDYHSPLYNMAEVIELGALKAYEARELLTAPMERMGLTFRSRSLVDDIVENTAGHPHLLQFICNQLLERMTATHPPEFTIEDWHAVRDSDVLKRYVTRNFKSNAGQLDELIVYATVASLQFSHPQLEQALKALGVNIPLRAREESLSKLKLVGILKEDGGKFEYSLPLFRRMLLRENISYFAAARARELREGMLA